jgi:hypothetical protein
LIISSSQLKSAGFEHKDILNVTVNVTSGIIAGSSSAKAATASDSITFFDITVKASTSMSYKPYIKTSYNAVTAKISGLYPQFSEDQIDFQWKVSPSVPESAFANGMKNK